MENGLLFKKEAFFLNHHHLCNNLTILNCILILNSNLFTFLIFDNQIFQLLISKDHILFLFYNNFNHLDLLLSFYFFLYFYLMN